MPAPAAIDGRNRRRILSYDRAVDALLDLIESGNSAPKAQEIADHSGISVRTVFRLTADIESLHAAAVMRQMERTAHLYVRLPREGALELRVAALIQNRAKVFEAIAPIRRVGDRLVDTSPQIADGLQLHHLVLRTQVSEVFGEELRALSRSRRETTLAALDVAASWETWDQLRRIKGLSIGAASGAMKLLVSGALRT